MECRTKDELEQHLSDIRRLATSPTLTPEEKRRQRLRSSPQIPRTMEKEKAEETEKEKAEKAKQEAMEEQWCKNGCFKDSSGNWVFPDELMWRSLPGGEDTLDATVRRGSEQQNVS
jgi:hypothetical protein